MVDRALASGASAGDGYADSLKELVADLAKIRPSIDILGPPPAEGGFLPVGGPKPLLRHGVARGLLAVRELRQCERKLLTRAATMDEGEHRLRLGGWVASWEVSVSERFCRLFVVLLPFVTLRQRLSLPSDC